MRNVQVFSQSFTNRPPNPLALPRFRPDAVKPGFHCVGTRWIRGFMAFKLPRRTRAVMLMMPV
jgi:hypothetical protein